MSILTLEKKRGKEGKFPIKEKAKRKEMKFPIKEWEKVKKRKKIQENRDGNNKISL